MAFGKQIEIDQKESELLLGDDREILACTGKFPNGASFEINRDGVRVKGISAPDFVPADAAQREQVKAALEAKFGARRIDVQADGTFVLRDTPAPTAVDEVTKALRERVGKAAQDTAESVKDIANYSKRAEKARRMGMVSYLRALLESGSDMTTATQQTEMEFDGTPDLKSLLKVSAQEAVDDKANKRAAETVVKEKNLGAYAHRKMREVVSDTDIRNELAQNVERADGYDRAQNEIKEIVDLAMEAARKLESKRKPEKRAALAARARDLGMVSCVRAGGGDPVPDTIENLRQIYRGTEDLEDLIKVALEEGRDHEKNMQAAAETVKKLHLDAEVRRRIEAGESVDDIVDPAGPLFGALIIHKDSTGTGRLRHDDEVKEILQIAVERANKQIKEDQKTAEKKRQKRRKQNNRASNIPLTEQSKWDEVLRANSVVSTIRFLRECGIDDDMIADQLDRELEAKGVDRREEILDYAFDRVGDAKFHNKAADALIVKRNLDEAVGQALKLEMPRATIEAELRKEFEDDGRSSEEIDELIEAAFRRAEKREKSLNLHAEARSRVPLTEESKWDKTLIEEGTLHVIRQMRGAGASAAQIRLILEARPEIASSRKKEALIEYALRHADDEYIERQSAEYFVKKEKLAEFILSQAPGTPKANIDADILLRVPAGTSDREKAMILEEAFEAAKSLKNKELAKDVLYRNPKKKVGEAARWARDGVKDKVIPGVLSAPGKMWKWTTEAPGRAWNWIKHNPDAVKKGLKYTALGTASLGVLMAGGLVAGASALVYVGKRAVPLTLNVGKHLIVDGAKVVQAVGQTAIVNPIKATGRVIGTPFKRMYQSARWATNYISKPTEKKPKGLFAPFTWMANKTKRAWYRSKQAGLALTAGSLFAIYGAGEGVINAASKDLLGLNAEVPELSIFHAPSGGHGHAPAAHGGGHGGGHGAHH